MRASASSHGTCPHRPHRFSVVPSRGGPVWFIGVAPFATTARRQKETARYASIARSTCGREVAGHVGSRGQRLAAHRRDARRPYERARPRGPLRRGGGATRGRRPAGGGG